MRKVVDLVRKNKIPVVFSESTISDRAAKQVARETGARYGGVLRNFQPGGAALHQDDDKRHLTVQTDDERPLVFYGDKQSPRSPGDGA